MRVIAGSLKGRTIAVPKKFDGRPTTDFAREGLFNVMHHLIDMPGTTVLDLFSGTGAFAIECFSRGAHDITCVEMQALHAKSIMENFKAFNIIEGNVVKQDVFRFLSQCSEQFDLVFADPPYDIHSLQELPEIILSKKIVSAGGLLIVEHSKRNDFSTHPTFLQERKYSNVHFSFFNAS